MSRCCEVRLPWERGRRSIWSSIARGRTGARSCCNSQAQRIETRKKKTGRGWLRGRLVVEGGRLLAPGRAYLVMSTSLVSGRKKNPTTAVIDAKMIGYQRPA